MFDIENLPLFLNLLIPIVIGILSFDGYDLEESGKKKIKRKFVVVIVFTFLQLVNGVFQISIDSQKQKQNEQIIQKRSEVAEKKAEERSAKFSQQIAEAMKKQELKIDTQSRTIINLSDTLSKIKLNQLPTEPIIGIHKDGIDFEILDDSLSFYIGISAFQNAAKITQLNCIIEAILSGGLDTLFTKKVNMYNNVTIPQDKTISTMIGMRQGRQISELVTSVNLYFYGTYVGIDSKKIIEFKEVYTYTTKTKATSSFKPDIRDSLFNQKFVLNSGLLKLN